METKTNIKDIKIEDKDNYTREEVEIMLSRMRGNVVVEMEGVKDEEIKVCKDHAYKGLIDKKASEEAKKSLKAIRVLTKVSIRVQENIKSKVEDYLID